MGRGEASSVAAHGSPLVSSKSSSGATAGGEDRRGTVGASEVRLEPLFGLAVRDALDGSGGGRDPPRAARIVDGAVLRLGGGSGVPSSSPPSSSPDGRAATPPIFFARSTESSSALVRSFEASLTG